MNKYLKSGFVAIAIVSIITVTAFFSNKDVTVSAQSQVNEAADRLTKGTVEYIKISTSEGDYTVHVRIR